MMMKTLKYILLMTSFATATLGYSVPEQHLITHTSQKNSHLEQVLSPTEFQESSRVLMRDVINSIQETIKKDYDNAHKKTTLGFSLIPIFSTGFSYLLGGATLMVAAPILLLPYTGIINSLEKDYKKKQECLMNFSATLEKLLDKKSNNHQNVLDQLKEIETFLKGKDLLKLKSLKEIIEKQEF
jgi:predicted Zn-dependent protease